LPASVKPLRQGPLDLPSCIHRPAGPHIFEQRSEQAPHRACPRLVVRQML